MHEGPTENRLGELDSLYKYYYYYLLSLFLPSTSREFYVSPYCFSGFQNQIIAFRG